jgi:hypothetical protein
MVQRGKGTWRVARRLLVEKTDGVRRFNSREDRLMASRHSKEEGTESKEGVTEAWRRSAAEGRTHGKTGEGDEPHRTSDRPAAPDDADLQWHRRELEEGWRHPQYEGFYDESSGRERHASSHGASAEHHAGAPHPREKGERAPEDFGEASGPESGKGPKGYRQGDARLFEEVCERLTRHGQLDARGIKVSCEKGEIVLRGFVNDEEAKKFAEACASSVRGVQRVRNKLKLRANRS